MCARYDVETSPQRLAEELEAAVRGDIPPRATIAPTDVAPALIAGPAGERWLVPMKFGWPPSMPKERIHLNTRSESAARTEGASEALAERRCLLPAHAFHEWSGPKGKRAHHLLAKAEEEGPALFTMAGLYLPPEDGAPARFVILTTAASRDVRPFHHRMPLVVPPGLRARWLAADEDPEAILSRVRHADAPRMLDRARPSDD
ncbi:MAG: SOS response-associated peptidase family protein [Sandaracinus sp.]